MVAAYLARPKDQTRTQYLDAIAAKATKGGITYRNSGDDKAAPVRRWMNRAAYKKALQRAEARYQDEPAFKAAADNTAQLMRVLIDSGQQFHEPAPPKRQRRPSKPDALPRRRKKP